MAENASYVVRPLPKAARTDMKDLFWVYLSPANLLLHHLQPGDACRFETSQHTSCSAIVFDNPKIQDSVIQTSKTFQGLYHLKLGDKITLRSSNVLIPDAQDIVVRETSHDGEEGPVAEKDRPYWAWILEDALMRAVYLCPGLPFDKIEAKRQKRSFQIFQINGSSDLTLYRFMPGIPVSIRIEAEAVEDGVSSTTSREPLQLSGHEIAGLDSQLAQINDQLACLDATQTHFKRPPGCPRLLGGVIVHGPPGTGKSLLLRKVAELGWRKVLRLDDLEEKSGRDQVQALRQSFSEARQHQPSVVLISRLETIAGKVGQDYSPAVNIAKPLLRELDALSDAQVLVFAETNDISKVDTDLRKPGRLDLEIETTVPDIQTRREILRLLCGLSKGTESALFDSIGARTHGYVGLDLQRLVQHAWRSAMHRVRAGRALNSNGFDRNLESKAEGFADLAREDFNQALLKLRPSAMREVFLETPSVRWNDIGGQHHIKKILKQAIEWPLVHSDTMKDFGLKPQKGLLLYGPPGCSKTLVAKAIATESDLNFIAVKGAELLSMYVGESERAVREVFRKARSASPSIIFFDEIDSLGASRGHEHGGLNVQTTLLNELDGIEDLKGVFVLAATNNPEVLDRALIRPGRLTTLLFVGLPDFEARAEILQLNLRLVKSDPNVEINELAETTEGYSGAEIVEICRRAGHAAMEKQMEGGLQQSITLDLMKDVIARTPKGITSEQLQRYDDWRVNRR